MQGLRRVEPFRVLSFFFASLPSSALADDLTKSNNTKCEFESSCSNNSVSTSKTVDPITRSRVRKGEGKKTERKNDRVPSVFELKTRGTRKKEGRGRGTPQRREAVLYSHLCSRFEPDRFDELDKLFNLVEPARDLGDQEFSVRFEDPPRFPDHVDPVGAHQAETAHDGVDDLALVRVGGRTGQWDGRAFRLDHVRVLRYEVERDDFERLLRDEFRLRELEFERRARTGCVRRRRRKRASESGVATSEIRDERVRREGRQETVRDDRERVDGPV